MCVCAHTHIYIYICVCVCLRVQIKQLFFVLVYLYIYKCIHTYMYIDISIYIYIYISNCPTGEPRHRAWVYTSKLDAFPPKLAGGGGEVHSLIKIKLLHSAALSASPSQLHP